MKKILKISVFVLLPLLLILGVVYGLAKFGVIPIRNLARANPKLRPALKMVGLDSPALPARQVTLPPVDPLAGQKLALKAQQDALEKERVDWQNQKQSQQKAEENARIAAAVALDPKSLNRMAAIYEQMPPETATRIFAKLPDPQVIALLRRMDEKQVAQILAAVTPDRAARLTQALSRPASPERTASSLP